MLTVLAFTCAVEIRHRMTANIRVDGRGPADIRAVSISVTPTGAATVTLGRNVIHASVQTILVEPTGVNSRHGRVIVALRDATCRADTRRHPVELAVDAMLRNCRVIDTESLCVIPGQLVWNITVNLTVLCDGGNILDAACWATMVALRGSRHNDVTIQGSQVVEHSPLDRDPVSLPILHTPVTISGVFLSSGDLCLDPSQKERDDAPVHVSVSITRQRQVCRMSVNGSGVSCVSLKEFIERAHDVVKHVTDLADSALDAANDKRKAAQRDPFRWAQTRTGVTSTPTPPAFSP